MSRSKVKIEHREGDVWKSVKVDVGTSRNGNFYAKYHEREGSDLVERILVWKDFKEGTKVVCKVSRNWIEVGRITKYGEVFLGEGQSYDEYAHSPEGLEASKKIMESWRKERFGEQKPVKRFEYPDLLNGGDSQ